MQINEKFDIKDGKIEALYQKIASLNISLDDIEESFEKGSGKGGQKLNKTSNKVVLKHLPTGVTVSCQRERQRNKNRFIALRALIDKLELHFSGKNTTLSKKEERIKKQKKDVYVAVK